MENCVVRYRTLSGGIGESPSSTHMSDYANEDEFDLTNCPSMLNGMNTPTTCKTNASHIMKPKQNNHLPHLTKTSTMSYQKATVHNVGSFILIK